MIGRFSQSLVKWIKNPAGQLYNLKVRRQERKVKRRLSVEHDTELVIEGYPRSANTFAVVAFGMAQDRDIKIAHHLHSVDQVVAGVESDIPVCLLIRDPISVARSCVLRNPDIKKDHILLYVEYYTSILRYIDKIVIAPFEDVTTDLGKIIRKINEKYGTLYKEFEHTRENCEAVYNIMDGLNEKFNQGAIDKSSTPDERRKKMLKNPDIDINIDTTFLDLANSLHEKYLEHARKQ